MTTTPQTAPLINLPRLRVTQIPGQRLTIGNGVDAPALVDVAALPALIAALNSAADAYLDAL